MPPHIVTLDTPGGGGRRPGRPARPRMDWTGHTYKHESELTVDYSGLGRDYIRGGRSVQRTMPEMPGKELRVWL